jgi:glycosyltransferase involved in cell wall biosynthesis
MSFSIQDHFSSTALLQPRWAEPTSSLAHVPFLFWLIERLRPERIVDLRQSDKNTFFAAAQAVSTLGLDARVIGCLSESRSDLQPIKDHQAAHYGPFAQLVPGSDATFSPSGSSSALVLADADIQLDRVGWTTLSAPSRPVLAVLGAEESWPTTRLGGAPVHSFWFPHAGGLAVVSAEAQANSPLQALFECNRSAEEKNAVRELYRRLGETLLPKNSDIGKPGGQQDLQWRSALASADQTVMHDRLEDLLGRLDELVCAQADLRSELAALRMAPPLRSPLRHLPGVTQTLPAMLHRASVSAGKATARALLQHTPVLGTKLRSQRYRVLALARLRASPIFDPDWYRAHYPDVRDADPVEHYLLYGAAEGRNPGPHFNTSWYLKRYPDVARANVNPLLHFISEGGRNGRDPNEVFDSSWYIKRYPDVALSGANPLEHFIRAGSRENRDVSPFFSGETYVTSYPDVAEFSHDPLAHYLQAGRFEGRQAYKMSDGLSDVKIAVAVHLFYDDLWDEIAEFVRRIPIPFDLFVTIPFEQVDTFKGQVLRSFPHARLVPVPNVGRDVVPFLSLIPQLIQGGYLAVCKLHTKKGSTQPTAWRRMMLNGLLGSRELIRSILLEFRLDPTLVIAGVRDLYMSGPQYMLTNQKPLERLRSLAYPGRKPPADWGFFAGTMFWARPELFERLAGTVRLHGRQADDGERKDGQEAHALERLLGMAAALEGGSIGLTDPYSDEAGQKGIEVVSAPGSPSRAPLVDILRRAASRSQSGTSAAQRPEIRAWTRPTPTLGVNFIGPVEFVSGLGVSARGYVTSLLNSGVATNVMKWRDGFERLKRIRFEAPEGEQQPINIVHLNLDLLESASLLDAAPLRRIVNEAHYNIAIIYWELAALKPEWFDTLHRFDEIWCSSSFTARAVSAIYARPVHILRPSLELAQSDTDLFGDDNSARGFSLPHDKFTFLYAADAGSVVGRKNPSALLESYMSEFSEDEGAFCLIKLHYSNAQGAERQHMSSLVGARRDVLILDQILSATQMRELYKSVHCYVSPHRSEGLGLTLLESMSAGKPVIATPYGGVTDFISDETALPLEYSLIEVGDGNAPYPAEYIWAEPARRSLQTAMRQAFKGSEEIATRAKRGQVLVQKLFSPTITSQALHKRLHEIWEAAPALKPRLH